MGRDHMMFKKKNLFVLLDSNKSMIFGAFAIVIVFSICLVSFINKGTFSNEEFVSLVNSLSISCPKKVVAGSEVECLVEITYPSISIQGFSARYEFSEGLSFVSIEPYDGWELIDDENFVLVNLDGTPIYNPDDSYDELTDESSGDITNDLIEIDKLENRKISIATIKFLISDDASMDTVYKVELVNPQIGDGEIEVIDLNNAFSEITVASNVNTLEDIIVSSTNLNETFYKDIKDYTAKVDTDKITIKVKRSDENSKVNINNEIDLEQDVSDSFVSFSSELFLDYGTNTFKINVTSESGITNVYTLNIFRKYHFTSDVYIYDDINSYIYTGSDVSKEKIESNIILPDNFTKSVEDNMLIISYRDQVLYNINVLNIVSESYNIFENKIYINDVISKDDFDKNIVLSDGLSYRIYNSNGDVVNDNVDSSMTLKIYYDTVELDSFDINKFVFEFNDKFNVDDKEKFIKYLKCGTTVSTVINDIGTLDEGITVMIYDGELSNKKENDDIVATGDKLIISLNGNVMLEYIISVLGDSSGDGKMDLIDLSHIRKHIVGWVNPNTNKIQYQTGVNYYALDFNKDDKVDLIDLSKMRKIIVGLDE